MLKLMSPSGQEVTSDRVMALNEWAKILQSQGKTILFAGMGRPTYPPSLQLASSLSGAAGSLVNNSYASRKPIIREEESQKKMDGHTSDLSIATLHEIRDKGFAAIEYGLPAGDLIAREDMAKALSRLYQVEDSTPFSADEILFTTGGSAALASIFKVINSENPHGRIVTPAPYYSLHAAQNRLHKIDVMRLPNFKINAEALEKGIKEAQALAASDGGHISGFIFCYPNNPTGLTLNEQEWRAIATVLNTPSLKNIPIILDEAYAEMQLDGNPHCSLFQVAPELEDRIVILRSGTKAISAAGERMAIIACKNKAWLHKFKQAHTEFNGHASRSNSIAYSQAMLDFKEEEQARLIHYYRPIVRFVESSLEKIGAKLPDQMTKQYNPHPEYIPRGKYKVTGSFYVLADLSELFGLKIHPEAKNALTNVDIIQHDEALIYHLLFDQGIMVSPLSYFGGDPRKGFVRITCSDIKDCEDIIKKLSSMLADVRKQKIEFLVNQKIKQRLTDLLRTAPKEAQELIDGFNHESKTKDLHCNVSASHKQVNCGRGKNSLIQTYHLEFSQSSELGLKELKQLCETLEKLSLNLGKQILILADKSESEPTKKGQAPALATLKPFVQMITSRFLTTKFRAVVDQAWYLWVDLNLPEPLRTEQKLLSVAERLQNFPDWIPVFKELVELNQKINFQNSKNDAQTPIRLTMVDAKLIVRKRHDDMQDLKILFELLRKTPTQTQGLSTFVGVLSSCISSSRISENGLHKSSEQISPAYDEQKLTALLSQYELSKKKAQDESDSYTDTLGSDGSPRDESNPDSESPTGTLSTSPDDGQVSAIYRAAELKK